MPYPITSVTLNQNTINTALFNMIISQRVFDSKVASTELADRFRVDGTLYGDTKLYHSFDIGYPQPWRNDAEAANLLATNRNKSGKTQAIKFGVYNMISITIDNYLSKQAFMHEGTFAEFTGFLLSSLRKAKKVYDRSLINVAIGTLTPPTPACTITIAKRTAGTGNADAEAVNRLQAQDLAKSLAVLKANIRDNNRQYTKLDYLRSFDPKDYIAVWNVEKHADITKLDLPTIFHEEFGAEGGFDSYDLPAKWFGTKHIGAITLATSAPATVTRRMMKSGWYDVVTNQGITAVDVPNDKSIYLFAGDPIPWKGQVYHDYVRGINVTVTSTLIANPDIIPVYDVNADIAFMLVHKDGLPFMSGFEVGTEFWNPRSLTSNHYLIWGHNELEFLEEYPRFCFKLTA